jgi:hypothetical protein
MTLILLNNKKGGFLGGDRTLLSKRYIFASTASESKCDT